MKSIKGQKQGLTPLKVKAATQKPARYTDWADPGPKSTGGAWFRQPGTTQMRPHQNSRT